MNSNAAKRDSTNLPKMYTRHHELGQLDYPLGIEKPCRTNMKPKQLYRYTMPFNLTPS